MNPSQTTTSLSHLLPDRIRNHPLFSEVFDPPPGYPASALGRSNSELEALPSGTKIRILAGEGEMRDLVPWVGRIFWHRVNPMVGLDSWETGTANITNWDGPQYYTPRVLRFEVIPESPAQVDPVSLLPSFIRAHSEFLLSAPEFGSFAGTSGVVDLPSGTNIRILEHDGNPQWDQRNLSLEGRVVWRSGSGCLHLDSWIQRGDPRWVGVYPRRIIRFEVIPDGAGNASADTPSADTPSAYRWPRAELRSLVQAAPMSPYTRAILRRVFNRPVPEDATTFESIEAWASSLPASTPPEPSPPRVTQNVQATVPLWQLYWREINNGEYVEVEGRIDGYDNAIRWWTQSGTVNVPLSVAERGEDTIRVYVFDQLSGYDKDYGDTEYVDSETDGQTIESDLDEVLDEVERLVCERDEEDE